VRPGECWLASYARLTCLGSVLYITLADPASHRIFMQGLPVVTPLTWLCASPLSIVYALIGSRRPPRNW
jgi:hypothetical protein